MALEKDPHLFLNEDRSGIGTVILVEMTTPRFPAGEFRTIEVEKQCVFRPNVLPRWLWLSEAFIPNNGLDPSVINTISRLFWLALCRVLYRDPQTPTTQPTSHAFLFFLSFSLSCAP